MQPVDLSSGGVALNIPQPGKSNQRDTFGEQRDMVMSHSNSDSTPIETLKKVETPTHIPEIPSLPDEAPLFEEVHINYPLGLSEKQFEMLLIAVIVFALFSPQMQSFLLKNVPQFFTMSTLNSVGLVVNAVAASALFVLIRNHFQR